ncbi:phosphoesterase [Gordoniibacillus kamchatkensis]|uniref:Phosphoesterase n=1 Tax=Gordoniibacillus kamchatkensis TaxID=1590651 RepID=A0ABR5AK38_9BACL|nr:phosphoesterase [Paenibacillus sp. VKM B-2647]KIL41287.1 phosphoesterase [Paenibacillus sp. VKM B-2647]
MPNVFFISDHHFGHGPIIDYESRPFDSIEHMTETMVDRWNAVVGKADRVFHLGDFSFLNKAGTAAIVARLHGYKTLILGNHDRGRSRTWWLEAGFDEVSEFPLVYGGFYMLSHEPMYLNKHMPYVNIHGHIHGQKYDSPQYVNVSVEHWDYTPVAFETIHGLFRQDEEG